MATKSVQIGIDAKYHGAPAFKKAKDDVKGLAQGSTELGKKYQSSMSSIKDAIVPVGVALGAITVATKLAWDTIAKGSALVDARGDFDDLTASIGTTSDAMLGKLRSATGGLMTDAQLVADASNMMATGLGLSEAQIVAFSGAAAQLDWNLETLTDTLNTGSTRGLKEMGLSIDFVKSRMAELEAQGIATDEAFRMAILEAADKKIEAVGKKSEETAGQIQILQAAVQNVQDEFARGAAEGFADALIQVGVSAKAVGEGAAMMSYGFGNFLSTAAVGMTDWADNIANALGMGVIIPMYELTAVYAIGKGAAEGMTVAQRELAEMTAVYERNAKKADAATRDMNVGIDGLTESAINARSEWDDWGETFEGIYDAAQLASGAIAVMGGELQKAAGKSGFEDLTDAVGDNLDEIVDANNRAAAEAAQAWEEYAGRVAGAFDTAMTGLQDWNTADLVTPEMDVAFSIGGPSDEDMRIMEEYQSAYDNAAREVADLSAGIGTFGMKQEDVNKKLETANAEMAYYSGLMANMQIPIAETSTAHQDLAFNMDLVKDAIYDAGVNAGGAAGQLSELGVATGQFTPQMAEAALKAALFAGALEILSKEWKIGNIDTATFIASVNDVVTTLETNTVIELETKAKAGGSFQDQPLQVPAQMQFIDGDPVGPGEIPPVRVPVTIADDALTTAIGTLDGQMGEIAEQEITFSAEYAAVTPEGTEAIQTAITAIDTLVTFKAEYAEVTPGATDAIQAAITAIDGTVTFDGNTLLVDADIRRLESTRINVPVYFVAQNSVPTGGGGGGSSGGGSNTTQGGNKSTNMVINFNGQVDAPGVTRAIRNSMAQFYADVAREGVSW